MADICVAGIRQQLLQSFRFLYLRYWYTNFFSWIH